LRKLGSTSIAKKSPLRVSAPFPRSEAFAGESLSAAGARDFSAHPATLLLRRALSHVYTGRMSEYVVQKVEWFQFRDQDGKPFLVMVASLPNGFYTAVPCQLEIKLAEHGNMALAATVDEALAQLQSTLGGKTAAELFEAH